MDSRTASGFIILVEEFLAPPLAAAAAASRTAQPTAHLVPRNSVAERDTPVQPLAPPVVSEHPDETPAESISLQRGLLGIHDVVHDLRRIFNKNFG